MIEQFRSFLKARVLEENSDFKEWPDAFNSENIPSTLIDKSFHITYDSISLVDDQGCFFFDDASMNVQLFFKGYRDPQTALDFAVNTAHNIRRRAVNPNKANELIKRVDALSLDVEPIDTNDNAIIINLNFNIRFVSKVL